MRIPDSPRRALARFGNLAVRPVPLLLTLAAVELATVAWLAFDTPHNGWVWYSGGDATEYWTAQWAVAHGFVPQAVISYGLPVFYGWVPLVTGTTLLARPAGDRAACRRWFSCRSSSSSSGRSPTDSTAVLYAAVAAAIWVVRAAPDDARGRRPLPPVVRAVLPRPALGGSHEHGRPAIGRRGARDDVGGAARGRLRTRRPGAPRGRVRGCRDRAEAGQRVLRRPRSSSSSPAALRPRLALACAAGLAPALLTLIVWKSKGLGHLPITSAYAATREAAAGPVAVEHVELRAARLPPPEARVP